jgi:5-methylthioadenosine/S-adenosylhomocysteine deaminase
VIVTNGSVVTLDDANTAFFPGHVVTEGNRITAVGEGPYTGPLGPTDVTVDATGQVVMPGLVDLHYHTALAKGFSDHLPLWEYLDQYWYPLIRQLDDDAAYWAAMVSYAESLRGGVTTVNDMYRKVPSLAQAAARIGIRAVLSNDIVSPQNNIDTIDDNREAYRLAHGAGDGRVEVYVGFEWLPLGDADLLAQVRALANELGTGIHIHLNESLTEVEDALKRFGKRPAQLAGEQGVLGSDCVAAHCVWLDDDEIATMAATGTSISHNPSSNAKLGNGVARLPEMLAAGINVGVGHDAAECNNSRDLFQVMKFAGTIHRAVRQDSSLTPAEQVVRMATRNGSRALHHETGSLEVGKVADLIVIETRLPEMTPLIPGNLEHIYSHLVYAANASMVTTTIVDGRIVMRDRKLTFADEAEVVAKANEAFLRVLRRIEG